MYISFMSRTLWKWEQSNDYMVSFLSIQENENMPPRKKNVGFSRKESSAGLSESSSSHQKVSHWRHRLKISLKVLGRSLMIVWRINSWKPERVPTVVTFVCVCLCVCVCSRATEHTFWHRNLILGSSDLWDMRKKDFWIFLKIPFLWLNGSFFRFFGIGI